MTLSFPDFARAYADGSILEDAGWRAFDIENHANRTDGVRALKLLGYEPLKDFGFAQAAVDYNLSHASRAAHVLSLWWVWRRVAMGRPHGIRKREGQDDE